MDFLANELSDVSISKLGKWIAIGAMTFGGSIPYIPQYREIKRNEDAEGFSLFVCFTLLVANTLRIFFWFGRRYELPLLFQSIVMNFTMFIMIHLCVNITNKNQIVRGKERIFTDGSKDDDSGGSGKKHKKLFEAHTFSDLDTQYFWAWTDFLSYVNFMVIFHIICGLVMYILIDVVIFVELVGFLAVFIEALLGVPQWKRNYVNKSTTGMSVQMVLMWSTGDIFKTVYFLVREAPKQFWLCGSLQVLIDLSILLQVYWYRNNSGVRIKKQVIRPD